MASIYDNIIKTFLNTRVETGGTEVFKAEYYSKENGYKMGDWKNLKLPNFDINKAVKKMGWSERPFAEIVGEDPRIKGDSTENDEPIFGISNPATKVFGVHETVTNWIPVLFHEFGHMFLRHDKTPVNIFEELFYGGGITEESEAELFSYFTLTQIGASVNFELEAHNLKNYKEMIGELEPARIQEIEKKAGEFVQLGRA